MLPKVQARHNLESLCINMALDAVLCLVIDDATAKLPYKRRMGKESGLP